MTPMDAARAALKEVFGYDDFRPGQEDAVAAILRGRDVMAVMPTQSQVETKRPHILFYSHVITKMVFSITVDLTGQQPNSA